MGGINLLSWFTNQNPRLTWSDEPKVIGRRVDEYALDRWIWQQAHHLALLIDSRPVVCVLTIKLRGQIDHCVISRALTLGRMAVAETWQTSSGQVGIQVEESWFASKNRFV